MSKAKKTTTKPKVVSKKVTTKKIVKIVNPSDSSSVQYVDLSELKGEQLMDILRKTPKYQNMKDYAIKKAIGGAKQATVPQLRTEVEKITQIPSPVHLTPKEIKKNPQKKKYLFQRKRIYGIGNGKNLLINLSTSMKILMIKSKKHTPSILVFQQLLKRSTEILFY